VTTDVTARRFRLASPATWVTVLGGLAALSLAATIPLTLLAHQLFGGLLALVLGVSCAATGTVVARRFNRARYDADRTVAAFAARPQDAVDPHTTRADLLSTVHRALEPAQLWLREAER
jgi:hypothetical protein